MSPFPPDVMEHDNVLVTRSKPEGSTPHEATGEPPPPDTWDTSPGSSGPRHPGDHLNVFCCSSWVSLCNFPSRDNSFKYWFLLKLLSQEMNSLNNNNKRLNRFHVPLNIFHPSPRFPSASRWRPVIPHQNEDRHQFCGRCIINGRFQLCCKGDGIGPQSIDIRNVYFTHCDEYLKLAT